MSTNDSMKWDHIESIYTSLVNAHQRYLKAPIVNESIEPSNSPDNHTIVASQDEDSMKTSCIPGTFPIPATLANDEAAVNDKVHIIRYVINRGYLPETLSKSPGPKPRYPFTEGIFRNFM